MPKALIIGGGIAGCVMALTLQERGWQVHLTDYEFEKSASKVAAGIFNPITGKRFSLTWEASKSWEHLLQFYPAGERQLGQSFFHLLPVFRFLHTREQLNDWSGRADDERFQPFLSDPMIQDHPFFSDHQHGFLVLKNTGWLDTKMFIAAVQKQFTIQNQFSKQRVDVQDLIKGSKPYFNDQAFDICIQCSGIRPFNDPLWHWLPFTPMRGEVIDVRAQHFPEDSIFVKKHFILPMGKQQFRIGSTYDWRITEEVVTEEGQNGLLAFAKEIMGPDLEFLSATAGVRPAVKDRRPLVGKHPENDSLYLFNGFGSKAVSLTPWLAHSLADLIETGRSLPPAADVQRFF